MICEKADQCNATCYKKAPHFHRPTCDWPCRNPKGILDAFCVEVKPEPNGSKPAHMDFNACGGCGGEVDIVLNHVQLGWKADVKCTGHKCYHCITTHPGNEMDANAVMAQLRNMWNAANPVKPREPEPAECMHCGAKAELRRDSRFLPTIFYYDCTNHKCKQSGPRSLTEQGALAPWNKQQGQAK